tara:strand:+ start:339 stop:581 length:243 start_codon:yes stop_codon:yes gene_type:complete
MPQIGWLEILIIISIAIIVVGPKDFPIVLKKIGSWIGTVKKYINNVQTQVSDITNENVDMENDINSTNNEKENKKELNEK